MGSLAAFGRLAAAGWSLARNDALLPRELDGLYPPRIATLSRSIRGLAGRQAREGRPGERLARSLEGLGPVAIKLGQLLSTRADIFGAEFADDLSRLKDKLDPFPTDVARREVEACLGRPIDSLYSSFGEPVAAASLAQAHDATLLDGRRVAVKVLRPGIAHRVAQDAEVLALAARLMEKLSPDARRLEPRALASTVIRATELELDLRLEAAGGDELGEVMAKDGYMAAPKVVWDGVGKTVLTQEWAKGAPLSDPASLELEGLDRPALADKLLRAFLSQALDHGVFHADLHEGNLFVAAPAEIMAVDFGIVGRLAPAERRYLAEILWGFLQRDYEQIARTHFEAGYVPRTHSVHAFAQALRAVGEPLFGRTASDVSMGRVLTQLFEITALFDMRLQPQLVLLQKTMMTVEGVARRLDPDHDIWKAADPVVRRWMLRELGPQARVKRFVDEGIEALRALHRLIENPPPAAAAVAVVEERPSRMAWFAIGAAAAGAAFMLGVWLL
ncbi:MULTISPECIES: 2-polyprenylphenol 6-hydroxylase [unclassified Phenylobacterium]|uniref:2-polyprenylphenol 6-hydroxylase n=1 Tax=unclassified Phenylobacterium TaxID=2640670 RepID=UPI0022B57AF2|nr:2-polyprenylphenol 6-hydroxylase [Phenylobacterium sp. NIBR 498073]MBS0489527.1 2-polyprenylphenol 6-hydroxylase [Pseudomonadota bacterium]WGU40131.1 2-polyprenylphenol 6-hydroxylase [Phenylobacterium sp. NIBR 498073]